MVSAHAPHLAMILPCGATAKISMSNRMRMRASTRDNHANTHTPMRITIILGVVPAMAPYTTQTSCASIPTALKAIPVVRICRVARPHARTCHGGHPIVRMHHSDAYRIVRSIVHAPDGRHSVRIHSDECHSARNMVDDSPTIRCITIGVFRMHRTAAAVVCPSTPTMNVNGKFRMAVPILIITERFRLPTIPWCANIQMVSSTCAKSPQIPVTIVNYRLAR